MVQALRQLAEDFLSAILFFAVYAMTGSLAAGVVVAVAVGVARIVWLALHRRPIELMQWMSLGLVAVFGAATVVSHSPRLMMLKPSIIHLAVAAVMLRRGWMRRYLPPIAVHNVGDGAIVLAGYAWAALLGGIAIVNLFVALRFDVATWAWFISVGAVGAKVAAFLAQYVVFRAIVVRRLASSSAADGAAVRYSPTMAE